jgi:hypothetical protein
MDGTIFVKFRSTSVFLLFAVSSLCDAAAVTPALARTEPTPCVILLHGLARTTSSMNKMEDLLSNAVYFVRNKAYPSREKSIDELAAEVIPAAIEGCTEVGAQPIHFVTHSLGGILIRYFLETNDLEDLGRVVMLSPPNQGSEIVDKISGVPGYELVNGPAGMELGTDEDDVPLQLGPAKFDVGIITGSRSVNLILSLLIPGDDDGKVSIERARLEGMADFLIVPHSHPFIMKSTEVIRQVIFFIEHGRFDTDESATD